MSDDEKIPRKVDLGKCQVHEGKMSDQNDNYAQNEENMTFKKNVDSKKKHNKRKIATMAVLCQF